MEINQADATRWLELVRRARVAGMREKDMQPYVGDADAFERAIDQRRSLVGLDWTDRQIKYRVRRKKLAAAYLAGASLSQLAMHEGVSTSSIQQAVAKEIPAALRITAAIERTASGRRREPKWQPSQVTAMLLCAKDDDIVKLPVVIVAARMQATATAPETSESDEGDPVDDTSAPDRKMPEEAR